VVAVERPGGASGGEPFAVRTRPTGPAALDAGGGEAVRRARAVALASGYFNNPGRLGVPGEDRPWVSHRYVEPYPHYGGRVVVVGGGNSAAEAALDLWRAGARVTLVCRGAEVRGSVKYWLKPDLENRVRDGAIDARFRTEVAAFTERGVAVRPALGPVQGQVQGQVHPGAAEPAAGGEVLPADAAYVLVGYRPDTELAERSGVAIDPVTRVPAFDPETLESNVPGLYVAGTLQAGCATDKIFIENTRDHGEKIVRHLTGSG
jgi:thioredoxin reductase (NADPH)